MPFVAGNDIDAFCPRCSRDRKHTVIEVHGGLVQEVRCAECRDTHRYQRPHIPPKPVAQTRTPARRRTTKKKTAAKDLGPPREWQEKVMGREPEIIRPYSAKEVFELNDIIEHRSFGRGIVTAVQPDQKIEVAFRDGRKKLVHSRT